MPASARRKKGHCCRSTRRGKDSRIMAIADALVFYNRVKELSHRQINVYRKGIVARPATVDQILGAMIAHELGHVLLNLPSHTETGIMRGDWDLKDLEDFAYGDLLLHRSRPKPYEQKWHVGSENMVQRLRDIRRQDPTP